VAANLIAALGLMLILEGLMPLLSPPSWRAAMRHRLHARRPDPLHGPGRRPGRPAAAVGRRLTRTRRPTRHD
jgi:hypothetical protein